MGFSPGVSCPTEPGDKPFSPKDATRALLSPSSELSLDSPTLARTLSTPVWQTEASIVESTAGVVDAQPRPVPKQQLSSAMISQSQYRRELVKYHMAPQAAFSFLRLGDEDGLPSDPAQVVDPGISRTVSVDKLPTHIGGEGVSLGPSRGTFVGPVSGTGDKHQEQIHNPPSPQAQALLQPLELFAKAPFSPHGPLSNIGPLTPPAEHGELLWSTIPNLTTIPMHSPETDEGAALSQPPSIAIGEQGEQSSLLSVEDTRSPDLGVGIGGAINVLRQTLQAKPFENSSIRILSHVLPCPSLRGQAFQEIISAIQGSTPASPTVWINIFHAVPGRFNLADLPKSPPATPGPAVGGEDYFTQRVFDSAVAISDYQHEYPRTPCFAVQPSSLNVSVIERYIPPTSPTEFSEMFNIHGSSILVDRLVELSPNNGSLIFIYPTKKGAQTFMHDYLSPLLDPLLRSIVVVNGLSSDLSVQLGQMKAADKLPDYETLLRRTKHLCRQLSQHSTEIDSFYGQSAHFALTYASKHQAHLPRDVWATSWWAKQEKNRIRETMQRYVQDAATRISHERALRMGQPVALMQELIDGVGKRAYPSGEEPRTAIELAVFVITRSQNET